MYNTMGSRVLEKLEDSGMSVDVYDVGVSEVLPSLSKGLLEIRVILIHSIVVRNHASRLIDVRAVVG